MANLKIGTSRVVIPFTEKMLPNFGEYYTHVHDETYVQVLTLETDKKYVFVAVGLVGAPKQDVITKDACEIFGVEPDQVIIHGKHVLSTPHIGNPGGVKPTPESLVERSHRRGRVIDLPEAEILCVHDEMMTNAVMNAVHEALLQAASNVKEAKIGFGLGYSETNVNRVVHTNKGWWQGYNPDGITDRSVPVVRFDDLNGNPIAILFNVNTAPGTLENSFLADGRRAVSGDIAAAAERWLDAQYPGAVSIWTTGATGDQWQALRALQDTLDVNGNQVVTDLHEQGFVLVDIVGQRLGEQVAKTVDSITTAAYDGEIKLNLFKKLYHGQTVSVHENDGATTDCRYLPADDVEVGFGILQLGNTAVVLVSAEMGVRSYRMIKEQSPFAHTFIIEFTNAGKGGGGYMVERDLYEKMTYQSRKSKYAAGTAEEFRTDVINALKQVFGS